MHDSLEKKKITVRIRENSWLALAAARRLRSGRIAMVVGRTIHLYNTTSAEFFASPSWVLHELKHVEQYGRLGVLRFLYQYLRESARNGYYNNRFEVEARAAEEETGLLDRYGIEPAKKR